MLSIAVALIPGLDLDMITLLLSYVLTVPIPIVNSSNIIFTFYYRHLLLMDAVLSLVEYLGEMQFFGSSLGFYTFVLYFISIYLLKVTARSKIQIEIWTAESIHSGDL
jgi:hypothetical protein